VDELETRNLVERHPNPADRRVREIYLTDAGRKALEQAFEQAIAYESHVTAPLGSAERRQLLDLLDRISANLGIGPGAHPALRETVGEDEPR